MAGAKPKKKAKEEPTKKRVPWLTKILGGVGLVSIVGGLSLMEFSYWICVATVCIGFVAVLVEVIRDEWFIDGPLWLQVSCVGACFIGCTAFMINRVFIFDDSEKIAYSVSAHQDGDVVEGISWNSRYADVRAVFGNPSSDDFEHVDIPIYPPVRSYGGSVHW